MPFGFGRLGSTIVHMCTGSSGAYLLSSLRRALPNLLSALLMKNLFDIQLLYYLYINRTETVNINPQICLHLCCFQNHMNSILILTLLYSLSTSQILGEEVSLGQSILLQPLTASQSLVVGYNTKQFSHRVPAPVYHSRIVSAELQEGDSCSLTGGKLQTKVMVNPMNSMGALQDGEQITEMISLKNLKDVYAVTTAGKLIHYKIHKGKIELANMKEFGQGDQTLRLCKNPNQDIFLVSEGRLYGVVDKDGIQATFIKQLDHPIKMHCFANRFVFLYTSKVALWNQNVSISQQINLSPYGTDFFDMDVENNTAFVLSKKSGVGVVNLEILSVEFYRTTVEGEFHKIKVIGNTVEALYSHHKHTYLVEMFLIKNSLNINRIYREVRNIMDFVLLESVAVLMSDTSLYYVEHSINRHILNTQNQELIDREPLFGASRIFLLHPEIFVVQMESMLKVVHVDHKQKLPSLNCYFMNVGVYNVQLEYKIASCKPIKEVADSRLNYCTLPIKYEFTVRTLRSTILHILIQVVLVLAASGLVITLICMTRCCRRLTARKAEIVAQLARKLERLRKGSSNGSSIQSFQKQQQKTLQDKI